MQQLREDNNIMKMFNDAGYGKEGEGVFENEISDIQGEIFGKSPVIQMSIDSVSSDLSGWAETLKANVKLSIIKKYVDSGNFKKIIYEIPEEGDFF